MSNYELRAHDKHAVAHADLMKLGNILSQSLMIITETPSLVVGRLQGIWFPIISLVAQKSTSKAEMYQLSCQIQLHSIYLHLFK